MKNLPRSDQTVECPRCSRVPKHRLSGQRCNPVQTRKRQQKRRYSLLLNGKPSLSIPEPQGDGRTLILRPLLGGFCYQIRAGLGRGQGGCQPLVTRSSTPSSVSSPSQGCDTQRMSLHLPPPELWRAGAGQSSYAWAEGATACWCSWQHYTDKLQSKCSLLRWTHCVQRYSSRSLKYNKE